MALPSFFRAAWSRRARSSMPAFRPCRSRRCDGTAPLKFGGIDCFQVLFQQQQPVSLLSNDGFFVLLCAQLLEEVGGLIFSYAAASTLWRRRSKPARPYMDRLMTFSRLICPSTGPVLQGSVKAACTASRS